jgi:5-methylcytosine-specific restriction endonuclease McrA
MKKTKIDEQTSEQIKYLVDTSTSIGEICQKLNYTKTGYNFKRIKERIASEGLTITPNRWVCGSHRAPLEDILVENSDYTNNFRLKIRLVQEEKLEYKCKICGNLGEWMGKPLSLQLDHINGVNDDNRLENLRFLCANCHSQTETYCGKKRC